jgi:hypothetical protein
VHQINHPNIPPLELLENWYETMLGSSANWKQQAFTKAAQWGASQQLEKDAEWLDANALFTNHLTITPSGDALRQVMGPKPLSLKEQALAELEFLSDISSGLGCDGSAIRRALEQLDD